MLTRQLSISIESIELFELRLRGRLFTIFFRGGEGGIVKLLANKVRTQRMLPVWQTGTKQGKKIFCKY